MANSASIPRFVSWFSTPACYWLFANSYRLMDSLTSLFSGELTVRASFLPCFYSGRGRRTLGPGHHGHLPILCHHPASPPEPARCRKQQRRRSLAVRSTTIVTGSEAGHILTRVVPVPCGLGLPCCPTVCLAPTKIPTLSLHEHEQQLQVCHGHDGKEDGQGTR